VISAGGDCILGGVLPTPAVALLALDLGVVISASHNPPEYNGVKFFDAQGHKLSDASEEQIEELLAAAPGIDQGRIEHVEVATDSYRQHILDRFGSDLAGLRIVVDCANGAYAGLAPNAFERCGAEVLAIGDEPDGTNINVGCGATDLALLQRTVVEGGYDLGVAFDGDGDRMLAVDEKGAALDGDQIIAILALDQEVDQVAVTVMTNLGLHILMREHDIRVHTTNVGDRYVLEALQREGGLLGGEQSGHIIYLRDHVTGDGLAAGLLLCGALRGRTLSEVASVMTLYPQCKENVRVRDKELTPAIVGEVERLNREWEGNGRVLVRASGTEPLIRVLAEAENAKMASQACASIAKLVQRELG
jgi:phosphoglucosamine mutase